MFFKFQLFIYKVTFRHATEDFFLCTLYKKCIYIIIFVNTGNVILILLWTLKLQIIFISETKNYSFPLDWQRLPWVCPAFVVLSHARYFFTREKPQG